MMVFVYGALLVGLALWEVPPLWRDRLHRDAAAWLTVAALAAGLLVLLAVLVARGGADNYLW